MKKILLALTVIVLLSGCATFNINNKIAEYTNEEAAFSMKYIMDEAHKATVKNFYKQLQNDEDYIPEEYEILLDYKDRVVGLKTILEKWKTYSSDFALDSLQAVAPEAENLLNQLEFVNAKRFIKGSLTSGTELFIAEYKELIKQTIEEKIQQLDLSLFNEAIDYYNAYQKVQKKSELLEQIDYGTMNTLAFALLDSYFDTFKNNEELIRTTPKSVMNQIVARVLGLE